MSHMDYHEPVMLSECIEALDIKPDGIYVDATFGGGGHTKAILKKLENGRLIAFDQDYDARVNADKIDSRSFTFIEANFRFINRYLKLQGILKIDGYWQTLAFHHIKSTRQTEGFRPDLMVTWI